MTDSYEKQCVQCGNKMSKWSFFDSKKRWALRKFCSRACKHAAQRSVLICQQCQKSVTVKSSFVIKRHRKFCSIHCRDAYWQAHPEQHGAYGHVGSKATPWLGKKLSAAHSKHISEAHQEASEKIQQHIRELHLVQRGPGHWNWKGGRTEVNQRIRNSAEYKAWHIAVLRRDHFTCQECSYRSKGAKVKDIVAHNVKSFKDYPDLRFDVSNGRTLCRACHARLHMAERLEALRVN